MTESPASPGGAPLNVAEYEAAAAKALEPGIYGWFAGGAGDERTLRANVTAFRRLALRPRVLTGVGAGSAATAVLGHELALPLLVAPVSFQDLVHPDGELAMARGAAAAGTAMCVSTMSTRSLAAIAAAAPSAPRWLQLYHFPDRGRTCALIDLGREAGMTALVLTVDAPIRGRREGELRTGFRLPGVERLPNVAAVIGGQRVDDVQELLSATLTWRDVEWLAAEAGMPLLLKGILTGEDAELACAAGAAGIIVSNHGGRQLDGVPAAIEALPEVADAVAGRAEVLMDGGVRRGVDVVAALALGARAVLAGRPLVWALAVDGARGVEHLLGLLRDEVVTALTLLGCADPAAVSRAHVAQARDHGAGAPA